MPIARKYRQIIARPKRPTLAGLILGKIAEAGEILVESFFPARRPEVRMWRNLLALSDSYEFKRATFSSILSQLQAQILVERRRKNGKHIWRITPAGQKAARDGSPAVAPPHNDGRIRLVCFDIAERDRAKRQWLRGELLALGYEPIQKSVWLGTTALPLELMEGLDTLELRESIHIFRVEGEGTLRGDSRPHIRKTQW